MASTPELVRLFNTGTLGKSLAEEFHGERGRVNPHFEDSEFLVVFPSEPETPKADAISLFVSKYYTEMGYSIQVDQRPGKDCFQARIFYAEEEGWVNIAITTHYPFPAPGQGRASLRVTVDMIV